MTCAVKRSRGVERSSPPPTVLSSDQTIQTLPATLFGPYNLHPLPLSPPRYLWTTNFVPGSLSTKPEKALGTRLPMSTKELSPFTPIPLASPISQIGVDGSFGYKGAIKNSFESDISRNLAMVVTWSTFQPHGTIRWKFVGSKVPLDNKKKHGGLSVVEFSWHRMPSVDKVLNQFNQKVTIILEAALTRFPVKFCCSRRSFAPEFWFGKSTGFHLQASFPAGSGRSFDQLTLLLRF